MKITDKMLHFAISYLSFSTIFLYCTLLNIGYFLCFLASFVITALVGIAKEVMDEIWDWKDILADVLGIIGAIIVIVILLLI